MAALTAQRSRQRSLLDLLEDDAPPPRRTPVARPAGPAPSAPARESPPAPAPEARATLDDLVAGAWETLAVSHSGACVVCGDRLVPRWGAGARPVAGACRSCGTELS